MDCSDPVMQVAEQAHGCSGCGGHLGGLAPHTAVLVSKMRETPWKPIHDDFGLGVQYHLGLAAGCEWRTPPWPPPANELAMPPRRLDNGPEEMYDGFRPTHEERQIHKLWRKIGHCVLLTGVFLDRLTHVESGIVAAWYGNAPITSWSCPISPGKSGKWPGSDGKHSGLPSAGLVPETVLKQLRENEILMKKDAAYIKRNTLNEDEFKMTAIRF